ncbi:hypothetical protein Q8A73_008865 [Channa argus]|nr:hypothetical protein Q8A73_008865 [Channa argus]
MNVFVNESQNDTIYDIIYDDEVCHKDEVVKFGSIAVPLFFSVVISLSLTGNILVLVILALYENLKSLTNIIILNLAISDLIFTAGLPFWAIYHIWGWWFSEVSCKIVTFVFFTGFYSSILFLTIMTIYRYLVVVHPLSTLSTQRYTTGCFVSFLIWVVSIGAAMPALFYSSIVSIPHSNDKHSLGCEYITTRTAQEPFKGFMLMARQQGRVDDSHPVGKFILLEPDKSKLLDCGGFADSAVMQKNNVKKSLVKVNWTAEEEELNITFRELNSHTKYYKAQYNRAKYFKVTYNRAKY